MSNLLFKRFRGYIAPFLLAYTILVTCYLVRTAWDDGPTTLRKRTKEVTHKYVPSKEERRYLRSIEDVDGAGHLAHERRQRSHALQNGRKVQSSYTNDFYVDEVNNHSTGGINDPSPQEGVLPQGGRDYILESRVYQSHSDTKNRGQIDDDGDRSNHESLHLNQNGLQIQHHNIEIEEMIPVSANESSRKGQDKNKTASQFHHHLLRDRKSVDAGKAGDSKPKMGSDSHRVSGMTDTHFCDNIDEDAKLCYRDRIVFSHSNHVNISSTHQSFKAFGGLQIYSAFLDTRQSPATIRIMTIGAKGYSNGGSSLWCAFMSPLAVTRRFQWTGKDESLATGLTQASQLYFYAASDGHNKSSQFYVMSCKVPDIFLKTLARLDGNRIDIVAGTQNSALLDTIQERVAITVVNNKGLPWYILKERALAKERDSRRHDNRKDSQVAIEDTKQNLISRGYLIAQKLGRLGVNDSRQSGESSRSKDIPTAPTEVRELWVRSSGTQDAIVSCVAPLYGVTGIVQITEFIELTLLLGSQHIVFYIPRISPDVRQILNMYKEQGLVTVLPWNLPESQEIWARGRDVALNDCLYRSMHLYDYVLFHDLDEFLIPKATPDLPSLLGFLRTKGKMNTTKISDIVFNSAYFPPPTKAQAENLTTMPGYTKDVPKFTTLRSLHRTYFNSQHTLRIIKPTAAIRVGAGERKRTSFYVNPRFAGVNHYTKCPNTKPPTSKNKDKKESAQTGQGSVDCVHMKWDDVIWKFKDKVIQNTKDSIRAFNAQEKSRSR